MLRGMAGALVTDLYELNMVVSYLKRGMTAPATFSLFIRELPPGWGFFIATGLEACLDHFEHFRFTDADLDFLRETQGYDEATLDALRDLRFTGDVVAVPEGRVVYPNEPLLEVTAPLPEAQLVETILLNQVTYQTAVGSKAARCVLAAPDKEMVDFALRRVHGGEAGIGVARATAIAGFEATSNVEAARLLGLRAAGTMAHSYIEAFQTEEEAFRAFAEDFPEQVVLLVDTYDTIRGVEKAIEVVREMQGVHLRGIRLDSGDLGALARESRALLDAAGMEEVRIFASGGLDERKIADLADTPIDAFGVGSRVGVAADSPTLDSVYKLVEYDGRPVAKLSAAKATLPGRKQVFRGEEGDVLGLRDEDLPGEPLLVDVVKGGERVDRGTWREARDRCAADLEALGKDRRGLDAAPIEIPRSEALTALDREIREEIRKREASH